MSPRNLHAKTLIETWIDGVWSKQGSREIEVGFVNSCVRETKFVGSHFPDISVISRSCESDVTIGKRPTDLHTSIVDCAGGGEVGATHTLQCLGCVDSTFGGKRTRNPWCRISGVHDQGSKLLYRDARR